MISKLVFIFCVIGAFIIGGIVGLGIVCCMITGKQRENDEYN